MAHMDRMIIVLVWGMREEQNSKRAREKILNKAPREPMDAMLESEIVHTNYVSSRTPPNPHTIGRFLSDALVKLEEDSSLGREWPDFGPH